MQKFTGNIGYKLMLCFWLLMAAGGLYFALAIAARGHDMGTYSGGALFLLMSGGVGLMALFGLAEAFAVYEVDANGITRRAWNGTRQIQWRDLTRFDATGETNSALVLTDNADQKMRIQRSLLGSKRAAELNALLEPYLTPLRARQLRDVGTIDTVYRPKRDAGGAGIIMLLILGLMLVFFLSQPVPADQWWAFVGVMVFFGGMCVLCIGLIVYAFTHALTVTEYGLTDSSVFRTRQLPFQQVTSVMSRTVSTKNGSYELTTVEGGGTKIALMSRMKDYTLLVDYIRAHVDTEAAQQGTIKAEEGQRKEQKQARILFPIFALLYFVMIGGMGLVSLRDGNARMEHYHLLETQGRTTQGTILGTTTDNSGKYTMYLIQYAFKDDKGQRIESASPVSEDDYSLARRGAPVWVTYVPGRKDVCMIAQSTGRKKAEGKVRSGYMLIAMGLVLTPLLALTPYLKRKK